MKAEIIEKLAPLVKAVMSAGGCCPELKAVCEKWLAEAEKNGLGLNAASIDLIKELEGDVTSIDGLLGFLGTDAAKEKLGAIQVTAMKAAAEAAKAKGEKYCICPACQAGSKILELKEKLLGE